MVEFMHPHRLPHRPRRILRHAVLLASVTTLHVFFISLMPQTARKLNVRNIYDPDENIGGGARLMRSLLDRFNGNLPLALAAYNAGADRVERYRTLPPIQETRRFVTKVLRFYRAFLFQEFSPQSRLSNQAYSARPLSLRDPAWDRGIASRSEAMSKSPRSSMLCCLQRGRLTSA